MHALAATDPLSAPTWLTAVGTLVLALFAIVTAWYARRAFLNQAAEVSLLQQQTETDQAARRQEAEERRRERAAMVYLTIEFDPGLPDGPDVLIPRDPSTEATVHNSGRQPIYDTRIHWADAASGVQAGSEDQLGTIAPHNKESASRSFSRRDGESSLLPVAYFRDAAGIAWTLLDNGELDEVDATYPPGTPAIAVSAVARSKKRTENQARLREALTGVIVGAERFTDPAPAEPRKRILGFARRSNTAE